MAAAGWARDYARGASFADEDYYADGSVTGCSVGGCTNDERTHVITAGVCSQCQTEHEAAMGVAS